MVKHMLPVLAIVAASIVGCGNKVVSMSETRQTADQSPAMVLRHVVLFAFKDGTTPEQVRQIENAFAALPSKIEAIADFEWGTDVSVENKAQGFTHCFVVTFRSEAGRAEYLPHPDHKAFGAVLHPHLAKVLVIDYWTQP